LLKAAKEKNCNMESRKKIILLSIFIVLIAGLICPCVIASYRHISDDNYKIERRHRDAVVSKETYKPKNLFEKYTSFSFIHTRPLTMMREMADSINFSNYRTPFGLGEDIFRDGFIYNMIATDHKIQDPKSILSLENQEHTTVDSLTCGYKEIFFIGTNSLGKNSLYCFSDGGLLFTTGQWYKDLFTFKYDKKVFLPYDFALDGMTLVWKFTCNDGVIQGAEVMLFSPWDECYGIYDLKNKTFTKFKDI
ncbi:MAG: hypothetical protein K2L96_06880, partial [Muribaculaceae bacterium]|nr:hypothetical protein [Muribaculaceae bacterium]